MSIDDVLHFSSSGEPSSYADNMVAVAALVIPSCWVLGAFMWLMAIRALSDPRLVGARKTTFFLKGYSCTMFLLSCVALFGNRTSFMEETDWEPTDSMFGNTVTGVYDLRDNNNVVPAFLAAFSLVFSVLLADSFLVGLALLRTG